MPRPHFTPGKNPVPVLQEAGWAPGAGLDGRKISSPPGFDPVELKCEHKQGSGATCWDIINAQKQDF